MESNKIQTESSWIFMDLKIESLDYINQTLPSISFVTSTKQKQINIQMKRFCFN